MLELYVREGCPYCHKVLNKLRELRLPFTPKDIYKDDKNRQMLLALGGKQMVPFLVDTDRKVQMYESDDIVKYLEEHYGKKA